MDLNYIKCKEGGEQMRRPEDLSREDLIKHLKLMAELTLVADGLWFLAAEEALDFDQALEMDLQVWSRYAPLAIKRLRKHFPLNATGLEGLKEIMLHDPFWWTMSMEIVEETPEQFIVEVRDCPSLMAMERMGREQLTCEPVETAYFEALVEVVDPRIKVKALKLPPRKSPDDVCCRWSFSLYT